MLGSCRTRPWHIYLIPCSLLLFFFLWSLPTAVAQATTTGSITGTVRNGTTNAPAPEGTEVTLHAYNSSYTAAETVTTALDADGRFQFSLTDKPADWVYMVSTDYQELSFSSNIAALSGSQPLDLSLTVYETTSDPANVMIDQLAISLNTIGQQVQVTELYTFANRGTAVFTSSSAADGVEIALPAAAQTPTFERGMGPNSGYFPANEVIEQDGRWVDTIALRPGPNSLILRVTYQLPAGQALDLSRALPYPVNTATLAVPDDGPQLAAEGWQQQPTQSMGQRGAVLTYALNNLERGSELALSFSGTAVAPQNATNAGDWILSVAFLLLAAFAALRLLRPKASVTGATHVKPKTAAPHNDRERAERWQMLFALADLDNAFKSGGLTETEYQQQRQAIKSHLRTIWEIE